MSFNIFYIHFWIFAGMCVLSHYLPISLSSVNRSDDTPLRWIVYANLTPARVISKERTSTGKMPT